MINAFKEKKSVIINRLFIFLFTAMFIASLCLTINAVAEITGLKFETATIKEKSNNVDASISVNNGEIENNVTFHKLNDYVIYNVVLKNNSDKDITITSIVKDSTTNEFVTYDFDQHKDEVVKAGENFSFDIKATYTNEQTDMTKRNQDIKSKFIINYLEGTEEKDTTVSINPKTNDEINMHLVLLFISSTGLIISIIVSKKNKHKESVPLVIFGLVVTPLVVKAATLGCNISIDATYNLNDKLLLTYNIDGEEKTFIVPYGEKIKDQTIPAKDGYIIGNWQDKLGNEYDLTEDVVEDKELVATYIYNETPTTETNDYNTFSYSAPHAVSYYVSTNPTLPINSDAQVEFSLDTWTTATSTGDLSLSLGEVYYVFAKDSDGNISSQPAILHVRNIIFERRKGCFIYRNTLSDSWAKKLP